MRSVILLLIGLALAGLIRPVPTASAQAPAPSGTVLTIAGTGAFNYSGDDGPATSASFRVPLGTAIAPDGSIYLADNGNNRIRRLNLATGIITTFAGNGTSGDSGDDGPAASAQIGGVISLAVDDDRNALYFADIEGNKVRKVALATGIMSRYAGLGVTGFGDGGDGGPALLAEFQFPFGVATDGAGKLSIVDSFSDRVRRVDPVTGIITFIAPIFTPQSVTADSAGNIYVFHFTQPGVPLIERIDAVSGIVSVVAGGGTNSPSGGSGPATGMNIAGAQAASVSASGELFIVSSNGPSGNSNQVWKVDLASGILSVYAGAGPSGFSGDGGPALNAKFGNPQAVTVSPAGEVIVSDTNNQRIRYIVPNSINLVGSAQTALRLPWISSLSGDFIVTDNPLLTILDAPFLTSVAGTVNVSGNASALGALSSLTTVGGSVSVNGNTSAATIDLGNLGSAVGSVSVNDNTSAAVVDLSSLTSVGSVSVNGNTGAASIDLGILNSTGGSVSVNGNTSAATIDLGSLTTAGGDVSVNGNTSAASVDLGMLGTVSGDVSVNGNTSAATVDLSGLTSTGGSVSVNGNDSATTIDLGSLDSVGGDATFETSGVGTFDFSGADVEGDTSLTADGYTGVAAATAGGETAVTMLNSEATMEVTLPDGAFASATPVAFSITNQPASVETIDGNTVTHLGTYNFEFAIPTLNSDAELNFEIELAAMDEPDRLSLLDLLHDGALLTLGVRGDEPGAELQLFDVCAAGGPVADSCAVVQWLDENRMLLDPQGSIDPAILRLEGLVGHFSTYSFVAVTLSGDYNHDGIVDAADYVVWRKIDGTQAGYNTWRANFGAVSLAIGAGSGSSSSTTVPEPASALLLILAAAMGTFQGRRLASRVLSTR